MSHLELLMQCGDVKDPKLLRLHSNVSAFIFLDSDGDVDDFAS
jgi:hypothetical protein